MHVYVRACAHNSACMRTKAGGLCSLCFYEKLLEVYDFTNHKSSCVLEDTLMPHLQREREREEMQFFKEEYTEAAELSQGFCTLRPRADGRSSGLYGYSLWGATQAWPVYGTSALPFSRLLLVPWIAGYCGTTFFPLRSLFFFALLFFISRRFEGFGARRK